MNNCILCKGENTQLIYKDYPGFIQGTSFDIYKCSDCEIHYILSSKNYDSLYDLIYSSIDKYGYDRYYRYASIIKKESDPLKYLALHESTYYPVYKYLKNSKNLSVLEIGCGYGYLTYALYKNNFNVKGIDISLNAINFAKENFGDFYINIGLDEYIKIAKEKYDLIIATEVIEHINDPNEFIKNCVALLNNNGNILLTTPDKDYFYQDNIWQTDLPPIHISWFGKTSMKVLTERNNLKISFIRFSNYYSKYENRLVKYFMTRKEVIGSAVMTKDGKAILKVPASTIHKIVAFMIHKIPPLRFCSNVVYNIMNGKENTLGVILGKNNDQKF